MKKCSKCSELKPKSLFYKNSSKKDGLQSYCITCVKNNDRKRIKSGENRKRTKAYYYKMKKCEKYTLKENARKAAWRERNITLNREINKRHYRENKIQYYNSNMKRMKTENALLPLKKEDWDFSLSFFDHKCAYCGNGNNITLDHVVPISRGGTNRRSNIVPACSSCNSGKRDRNVFAWYSSKSFFSESKKSKISEYMSI